MINYLNSVVGDNYSLKQGDATDFITLDVNPSWVAHETKIVSRRGENRLVWHWYCVGGQFMAHPVMAKLLYVWDLLGSRQGAAVIAIATDYENSPESGRAVLSRFSKYLTPTHVQEYIN